VDEPFGVGADYKNLNSSAIGGAALTLGELLPMPGNRRTP
jgi:hypothetical protein